MSNQRDLIAEIREHEHNATFARKTNEKELPNLKFLVSDIDKFGFGTEDLDLKQKLIKVADKISNLEVVGITAEILEECRRETNEIKDELIKRYRDRMDSYASRQSSI